MSILKLIDALDSFHYEFDFFKYDFEETDSCEGPEEAHMEMSPYGLYRLFVLGTLIGYTRRSVIDALERDFPDHIGIWNPPRGYQYAVERDAQLFLDVEESVEALTLAINQVAETWREAKTFSVLEGWRNERYTIYNERREPLFHLERAACALFGVVTYGAHLNVYIPATQDAPMRMWCPRRSSTKATFPGMLDNSVAGGISNGLSAWETIVKEAGEEASIPEDVARECIKPAGAISYIYMDGDVDDGAGWIQPEVQYVYDMPLSGVHADLQLRPNDGEAENFELWTMDKVMEEVLAGHFKPNCAAVIVDFMIRHGIITAENEPDYVAILQRIHRRFDIPV